MSDYEELKERIEKLENENIRLTAWIKVFMSMFANFFKISNNEDSLEYMTHKFKDFVNDDFKKKED